MLARRRVFSWGPWPHITEREAQPQDRRGDGQRVPHGLKCSSSFLAQTNDLPEYQGDFKKLREIMESRKWDT